jgi:hypothetical protein
MPFQPLGPSINPKLSSLSAILKQADEDIEQFISWQSTIKPPRLHRPSVPQRQQSFSRELHLVSKRKTLRNITNTIQASSATPLWQKTATNAKSRPPARLSANQRSQSDDSINTTTSHQSVPALFTSDVTSSSLPPSSSVGRLWSSGLNIAQQLGLRHYTDFSRYQPVKFLTDGEQNKRFLVDARLLACGAMSSYAVDQSGRLWSWGSNDDAALGVRCAGNSEADSAPIIVPLPFNNNNDESSEQIKQLAAGCSFVAVLTTQGRLFIWGTWIVRLVSTVTVYIQLIIG